MRTTYPGANFYSLNTYSLLNSVMADPSAYGFDNVTGTWLNRPSGDLSIYLFYDGVHPTTEAHLMLAKYAASAVPVPATFILMLSGLAGFAGIRKRMKG